ncbi:hypothetical protein Bca52824_041508 [Brassica carinata]|uniref:Uncharacterized protein n=1 Tax=Brassica carinata TaxID=52824 RepID=A0A8X7UXX0_BRACI|nr:hypothetical protein Bca52824_041508 [Brassica carinata]
MVPMSPPLRAQLLRPRCCRCEVSSGGGHCSSPRFVNIGFSTSQAHNLSISKSCSSCVCSVVADSQLPSTRSGEKCDLQHQWRSITFCTFGPLVSCFFHNMPQTSNFIKLLHKFTPILLMLQPGLYVYFHKWSGGF